MPKRFTPWQRAALVHRFEGESDPHPACMHKLPDGRSAILTCDIDEESAEIFGGPVWHASVCPPVRADAEALLAGVGEGVLFEEPGVRPEILHLRQRMTTEEMKLIGGES